MNINRITLVFCTIGTLFLAGCQRASEPPTPTVSTSESAAPAQSVAAPPSAVPPSDAAMQPPGQSASSSGDAGGPTQADPGTLSTAEEKTAMPQSGQVNNHSVPDTTSQNK